MTGRVPCCIPGCGRTFKLEDGEDADTETMCGRHWRMGDGSMRARHKQLRKRERWFARRWKTKHNAIARSSKGLKFYNAWSRTGRACNALWDRIKEDVTIKAAFGAEDAPRRRPG